jgi:hypothetical protein
VLLGTTDLTGVTHSVVVEVRFYFFFKVGLLPRLDRARNHQRDARALRGGDSAMCTLGVVEAADPQDVVVLLGPKRPLVNVYRVGTTPAIGNPAGADSFWASLMATSDACRA